MKIINEIVDTLIMKAKQERGTDEVRFIKAYRQGMAEQPFRGFVAVVNVESISKSDSFVGDYFNNELQGSSYTVKVSVKVYADRESSGENLGAVTLSVLDALTRGDDESIIESSSIGPITFDTVLGSIYREIDLTLEFCLCGEM